jgi:hypothetical protein
MCKAEGGKVVEKATGEKYASKKAMMKHEKSESPREQRQEMMKGKIPVRKSVPVASQSPLIAMKNGGKISEAKVGKVMNEFKDGDLHSGSKKGPDVTNSKQALAIALSEGRRAMKKK